MTQAQYVTPRNAAMACGNALIEIRAREADAGSMMSNDEQARIILAHLRDFFGGRIFILKVKHMLTTETLVDLICDDAECREELRAQMARADEKEEDR